MAFCLLLCGKEAQRRSSQSCFLNNLKTVDQWVWQRLGLIQRLFNGEYNGLCSFQIALAALV